MKTIIAGGRDIHSYQDLLTAVRNCGWVVTRVISGCARGADQLGEKFALEFGIICDRYPADWDAYGKSAGVIRNEQMIAEGGAEGLIALWDGESHGTRDMIERAGLHNLEIAIHYCVRCPECGKKHSPGGGNCEF